MTLPIHVSPAGGLSCRNERCISHGEGSRYLLPELQVVQDSPPLLSCVYCANVGEARFIGNTKTRVFHHYDTAAGRRVKANSRIYFETEEQARVAGYQAPSQTAGA